MKKFLVLYESTVPASEQMKKATPEQRSRRSSSFQCPGCSRPGVANGRRGVRA